MKTSVVRYGNVMNSRGSVLPIFISCNKNIPFPLTDEKMTRFNISIVDGIEMIFFAIKNAKEEKFLFQNCHPLKLKI